LDERANPRCRDPVSQAMVSLTQRLIVPRGFKCEGARYIFFKQGFDSFWARQYVRMPCVTLIIAMVQNHRRDRTFVDNGELLQKIVRVEGQLQSKFQSPAQTLAHRHRRAFLSKEKGRYAILITDREVDLTAALEAGEL
jgi:hypothetical protein